MSFNRLKPLTGRVLKGRTATLPQTIKVQITDPPNTKYHPILRKPVALKPRTVLVHDPTKSCIEGDVVSVVGGRRVSSTVRYTVESIVAPFGGWSIDQRPLHGGINRRVDQRVDQRMERGGVGVEGEGMESGNIATEMEMEGEGSRYGEGRARIDDDEQVDSERREEQSRSQLKRVEGRVG